MENINVDALFLGPKSENQKFLKEMINFMMDEHIFWRRDFHPEDKEAMTMKEQSESNFQNTLQKTREVLLELSSKLKTSSEPWFSPRYLGQMNSDVLMPAVIAYMATILYNPNNCAFEGAPATTSLEVEVGKQLAKMMGYDPEKAWGDITSGGHVANFEGTWFMRNLKSVPNAIKQVKPELVKGLDDWQLMNLSTTKILDLLDITKEMGIFDEVRNHSVRGTGMSSGKFGKLLVPQTKHYSWTKVVDIMGIGSENFVNVQVNDKCRMDINHLKEEI
ncbi:MAG: tyrosine decarboxylase, partial [Bacteroidales bacterium]|nr:tyrosine decarboxylase [Bacteroidales bacterium]